MLVVAGTINLDPDHLNEMLAAIVPLMEATQAEEGCIDYVLSADPKEPGTIRIFEKWASDEALGAHMKAPHMGVFQKAIRGCGVTGMSVDKFEIASESKRPVGVSAGGCVAEWRCRPDASGRVPQVPDHVRPAAQHVGVPTPVVQGGVRHHP